jgi:hypothetical protein
MFQRFPYRDPRSPGKLVNSGSREGSDPPLGWRFGPAQPYGVAVWHGCPGHGEHPAMGLAGHHRSTGPPAERGLPSRLLGNRLAARPGSPCWAYRQPGFPSVRPPYRQPRPVPGAPVGGSRAGSLGTTSWCGPSAPNGPRRKRSAGRPGANGGRHRRSTVERSGHRLVPPRGPARPAGLSGKPRCGGTTAADAAARPGAVGKAAANSSRADRAVTPTPRSAAIRSWSAAARSSTTSPRAERRRDCLGEGLPAGAPARKTRLARSSATTNAQRRWTAWDLLRRGGACFLSYGRIRNLLQNRLMPRSRTTSWAAAGDR